MAGWWESIKSAVGNAYCEVSDWSVWYATQVAELLDGTKIDDLGEAQRDIFRHWNNLVCDGEPDDPIPLALQPAFIGGQCENLTYRMTVGFSAKFNATGNRQSFSASYEALGALNAPVGEVQGADWGIRFSNSQGSSFFSSQLPTFSYSEQTIDSISVCLKTGTNTYDCSESAITTCGSPSGATPTNQPIVVTRDIDYIDKDGNPQTAENVVFTYGLPFVEEDGTISVPYEVCYDDFCYRGKTNFGDSLVVIPAPPELVLLPPNQELDEPVGEGENEPEPELDGEELDPADLSKKPILGVFVSAQKEGNKSRASEINIVGSSPVILAPNIGFVKFRIKVKERDGWTIDIPIKSVNCYVPVPDKLEAVSVDVAYQVGWKGKYVVHRGKHCCKKCKDGED